MEFKRKLYKRGSSFETTIPMPILFKADLSKKNNVVFNYDSEKDRWYLNFEQIELNENIKNEEKTRKSKSKEQRKKRKK